MRTIRSAVLLGVVTLAALAMSGGDGGGGVVRPGDVDDAVMVTAPDVGPVTASGVSANDYETMDFGGAAAVAATDEAVAEAAAIPLLPAERDEARAPRMSKQRVVGLIPNVRNYPDDPGLPTSLSTRVGIVHRT